MSGGTPPLPTLPLASRALQPAPVPQPGVRSPPPGVSLVDRLAKGTLGVTVITTRLVAETYLLACTSATSSAFLFSPTSVVLFMFLSKGLG